MSLLNDMLRDLSQRQPVADGAEGYDDVLLQLSSIARKKQNSWVQLVLFFVAIFIIVIGINFLWSTFFSKKNAEVSQWSHSQATQSPQKSTQKNNSVKAEPQEIIYEEKYANTTSPESQLTQMAVDHAVPATNSASNLKKSESAASSELQNHINELLQQAERAIGMERLTAPVEDNAYSYYQKILGMSPDNEDAKEGLDKIASRYLIKAQEQSALGNSPAAEALVQRARFVSARYVLAHEMNTVDAADLPVKEFAIQSATETSQANTAVQSRAEIIKPFVVAEASSISVSPNPGWKDEQLVLHAQELVSKGKQTEAQILLKNFIATEKSPALSAALLADVYLQQGNTTAADIIVEQTNYLPLDVKSKLRAQILSANGDDANAIALLEKNLNAADTNEGYRSLLASLYHKTANYQQSIISYQRLINNFGEKPAYWLGLALAYDGLSQHKSALQAYQRLREYPQIQDQVKQYTDQRIAALRSE
jgi:MSHA biogenesis protein MshN